jgi:hypothetical protein
MPGGNRYALAGLVISDIGYAIGGISGTNAKLARNEAYDPSSDTWTAKASMSTARSDLCAFVVSGIGYAVGGLDAANNTLAVNEAYNPITNTWSTKAPKPTAVAGACAFVLSNLGYVVSQTVNEAYDPVTDTWFTKESPPSSTARNYAAAFAISGVGYMAGGISDSTVSSAVEAFIPSSLQDAAIQAWGSSAFSLQVQRGRDASTEFVSRSACSALLQKILDATALTGSRSSFSASILGTRAITIRVTGASAVFGRSTAPVDISARSVGSSTCIALTRYSATFMVRVAAGSAWLADSIRAREAGPAVITGAATISSRPSVVLNTGGRNTGSAACSARSTRATTIWPTIVIGSSLVLLSSGRFVEVGATSRGTSTLLQHIAIEYPVAVTIGGATMVIAAGALLGMEESVYPGWPMRLDSLAGDLVIMFPTYAMEWETGGDLRTAFADVPLADYAFDLLGTQPAPRGATDETIRFVIVGQDAQDAWQQYMDMRSKLARIGRGRLWVRDASGNRYWAYVRPMGLATTTFGVENLRHFPVTLTFRRLSDWMARSASSVTLPGNGVHTVRISGDLPVKDLTIDIAATTANGYASPTIENYVTGERLTVNRVGSTDRHRLRILTRRWVALESSDGGLTWNDVTPALVVGSLQATVLRLEPTANILSISGCPGATITISWYDTYA